MTIISVGRQGQEIGDYYLDGIKEGLANGYFLPSDCGWYEGLSEWLPLNQILERLSNLPPPLPKRPVTPNSNGVAIARPSNLTVTKTKRIKQSLKPKKGEVTYLLKKEKTVRKKTKTARAHSWEDDAATDKQIEFLKRLGAGHVPKTLTKGEAHDQIDALLSRGGAHGFLSSKQLACLHYYGFDPEKLDYDEAKALLDQVHESPESFDVPEPWETAKYRLYPSLYPNWERTKSSGRVALILVLLLGVFAAYYFWLRFSVPTGAVVTNGARLPSLGETAKPTTQPPAATNAPDQTPAPPAGTSVDNTPAKSVETPLVSKVMTDADYHGTTGTNFGPNWVMVGGEKIEGITSANPAPDGQVAILYLDGGRNVPASSLPQGFLDAWKLTPERLKAAQ